MSERQLDLSTSSLPTVESTSTTASRANLVPGMGKEKTADTASDTAAASGGGGGGGGGPKSGRWTTEEWGVRGSRTRLEQLLMVTSALLAIVALAAIIFSVVRVHDLRSEELRLCMSKECVAAANNLLANMDEEIDPCDDFYAFACGNFERRIRIPDDKSSRSQFALIDDELELQLRDILEAKVDASNNVFDRARAHYEACMDEDGLESIGLQPLFDVLDDLGGWPVVEGEKWREEEFDWKQLVYKLRAKGYSTDYLIDFSIGTDIKNSTSRVIYFDQASIGMSREYLVKGLNDTDVGHYFSYMQKVAVALGADRTKVESELRSSLLFEMKLANISLAREERRNMTALYHSMSLEEMNSRFGSLVNFTEHTNNILTSEVLQVDEKERVVLLVPSFLSNLTTLLEQEPKRNVANYMLWRVARSSWGLLNQEARLISDEFSKNITGKKTTTPRWRRCVGSATSAFAAAIGKMYVLKHFDTEAKSHMLEMVADIRAEFDSILEEVEWMDNETRFQARSKLKAMKEYIGYPPQLLNDSLLEQLYEGIDVDNEHYFENSVNLSIWSTNYHWSKLREPVDKDDWRRHANPAVVNAFYSAIENSIQFPAGILQGVFFDPKRPAYMNYGAIGWVIGHEITHGFDDQGRQFDAKGNLQDWWHVNTKQKFIQKTQCIIWQYGNYTASNNRSVNGINTQGENIADNGGIKQAYRAYERWSGRHGVEARLPGLQSFSPRQLFWLSAANVWCNKYRPKALKQTIELGSHSPGRFRVQGPFANSQHFANDFKCKHASNMNPTEKCQVW